jgi:tetratricopeptide (TPR) repeat protein
MRDLKTLFGAAVVALVMTALPAAAQTGRIGGTVKDTNGQPIKGATVVAENPASAPSSFTATTDDRGRYSMIGLKAGSWKVTASAPGFAASSGNVPIKTIGAPMPPVDFTLAPGASGPAGALAGVNTKELQGELAKADAMVAAKDYAGAIGVYEAMVAKVPALTALQLQIGGLYRAQKQYDKAIETYKKVPEGDTNADKAKIEIGMTLLEKNDLAGAEAALMPMAQSTSANKEVFYNLGEVKFAKGETDEAVKYYQRASDIDPNWGKPLFKLGLARLQKGDTAGTLEIMNKLVQVDPNSPEAVQAKGLIEQLKK